MAANSVDQSDPAAPRVQTQSGGGQRFRGNFRQQEAQQRQVRLWRVGALESAITDLVEADLTLRSSSRAPGMAVIERALMRLAMSKE